MFETLTRAENLLEAVNDEDQSKMVQRVANEYTQLVYLLGKIKAEGCAVVDSVAPRIDQIRTRLSEELSTLLLKALSESTPPNQVLKTYELIEGWREAEAVLREHFNAFCKEVGPPCSHLIPY